MMEGLEGDVEGGMEVIGLTHSGDNDKSRRRGLAESDGWMTPA